MNERDTHFAGFAKLLVQELQQEGLLETWNPDFGEPDQEKVQRAAQLIAERAYDLAYYVLDNIWEVHNPEVLLESTPDLTEWPVEPDESSGSNPA